MRKTLSSLSMTACAITLVIAYHFALAATEIGQPAPPLMTTELSGGAFDLSALRGKVVVVNFWATWCVPCRTEMPVLDEVYRQYHGRGLEMIGLSADRPRDRDDVVKTMRAFRYPAAMLKDATANGFGAPKALPVTYVIDADGIVRAKFTPDETGVTEKELDDAIRPLLNHDRPGN